MQHLMTVLKGLFVGGTMMVPGVSGGSMAMILGIYEKLISSVSSFLKHKKESLIFLMLFCGGAVLGMVLFAKPLLTLIERFPMPTLYFFIGAVLGGVPLMVKESGIRKFSWKSALFALVGLCIVALLELIPAGGMSADSATGLGGYLLLALAGFIAAIALILPGISVSYMFLLLGLYDKIMLAISELQLSFLLPLGIGLALGVLLTTRILELAMKRHPQPTYMIILGFVLGSLIEVFPGIPTGWSLPLCIVTCALGYAAIRALSWKETHAIK